MLRLWCALACLMAGGICAYAQQGVAIGADAADPQAILDVQSTTKGVLIPRMTTAQRDAIAADAADAGLLIYNTTTNEFNYWDGSDWINLPSGGTDPDWYIGLGVSPPSDINDNIWTGGNVGIGMNNPAYRLDVAGDLRIDGSGGHNIWGGPVGSIFIHSNSGVSIDLENDGGSTGSFRVRNGSDSKLFEVLHSGNAILDGDLTITDGGNELIFEDELDARIIVNNTTGPSGALNLEADSDIDIIIDRDDNGTTAEFTVKRNGDGVAAVNKLFAVPESLSPLVYPYGTNTGQTGGIRFRELEANGSNYIGLRAPDVLGSNYILTLPTTDGTNGDILQTDGTGILSWVDPAGFGGPDDDWDGAGSGTLYPSFLADNVSIGTSSSSGTLTVSRDYTSANVSVFSQMTGNSNGNLTGLQSEIGNSGDGNHYGQYSYLYSTGNGQKFGNYQELTGGNGTHTGSYHDLSGTGTGTRRGTYTIISGNPSGGAATHFGAYHRLISDGNGSRIAIWNDVDATSTGEAFGMVNYLASNFGGNVRGIFNDIVTGGDSDHRGVQNILSGSGNGSHYGIHNDLRGSGSGQKHGVRNDFAAGAGGDLYGVYTDINATGSGTKYGAYNEFDAASGGIQYGVWNQFNSTNTYQKFGMSSVFSDNSDGWQYGVYTGNTSTSATNKYGTFTSINNGATDNNNFGHYTYIANTGSLAKYGYSASLINSNGAGPVYAFYANTESTGSNWAAYLLGKAYISYRLGIGVTDPAYALELSTNSAAKPTSNAWTVTSDRNLKSTLGNFEDGLAAIEALRPIWFTYNGEAGMPRDTGVGLIAQELQDIAPYMIKHWTHTDSLTREQEKYLAIDYGAMDFLLVNAVKELSDRLKEKDGQLQRQSIQIMELLRRIEELELRE